LTHDIKLSVIFTSGKRVAVDDGAAVRK